MLEVIVNRQEKSKVEKRGRPATGQGTAIGVRCHDELLAAIDTWRRGELDFPTRANAIRRLAIIGLKSLGQTQKT